MNGFRVSRALLLVLGTVVSVGGLAATSVPLGIPGEWTWSRREITREGTLGLGLALAAGVAYSAWAVWGQRRLRQASSLRACVWVGGLVPVTLLWWGVVLSLIPGATGLVRFPWVLAFPGSSGYFTQAQREVRSTREFLRTYRQRVTEAEGRDRYLHLGTHPPGLTLAFHGLRRLCETSPGLTHFAEWTRPTDVVESFQTLNATAPPERRLSRPDAAALWLGGLLVLAGAALGGSAIYGLARRWTDRPTAWGAAALWPLVPAIVVFFPKSDALFGGLAPALAWLWLRSVDRNSPSLALLFGLLLYGCLTLSLAFLPVALVIGLTSLLELARGSRAGEHLSPNTSLSDEQSQAPPRFRTTLRNVLWALAGFLIPTVGLWLWAGYDTPGVWMQNLRNHAEFYAHSPRSYGAWLAVNPLEMLLSVGWPVVVTAAWAVGRGGRRSTRRRAAVLAFGIVWTILWISGKNMGEAARLWCFLMAWPVLATTGQLETRDDETKTSSGNLFVLLVCQMTVCVVTTFVVSGFDFGLVAPPPR